VKYRAVVPPPQPVSDGGAVYGEASSDRSPTMHYIQLFRSLLVTIALGSTIGACSSDHAARAGDAGPGNPSDDAGGNGPAPLPFEAVRPQSYVSKVKYLLTGLAVTNDELVAVNADPSKLAALIDTWLALPEADTKLIQFFGNAFQQTQMTGDSFTDQIGDMTAVPDALLPNLREGFARTALQIMKDGAPFNQTVTTHTFMMTTALVQFYAFLDVRLRDDKQNDRDKLSPPRTADFVWTAVDDSVKHIPLEDSVNPASPNYLSWSVGPSSVLGPVGSQCVPRTFHSGQYSNASVHLFLLQYGTLGKAPVTPAGCPNSYGINNLTPILTASDFSDWRPVTITTATAANPSNINLFYDVPRLRKATSIVLDVPRVGFFTTPSFFANWPTNVNNLARVTTNQTLITALGRSFNPETTSTPLDETGINTQHADPTSVCYGCHKNLDPMRGFFRHTYSLTYHEQLDATERNDVASFTFGGVSTPGGDNTADALAGILATHGFFPGAWAQKLCVWANSAPCSVSDPEFTRIVAAFTASNLNFHTLVREMLNSPLVTAAKNTQTFADRDPVVSVARHDHFCQALQVRLGIDACTLPASKKTKQAQLLSSNIPADGYNRGAENPSLVWAPGLFHRSTVENLCQYIAAQVIDVAGAKYQSASKDAAIADFVANLMGLPPADDRAAPMAQLLTEHYTAAIAAGGKPADALSSTFVLACTSPLVTGIGL